MFSKAATPSYIPSAMYEVSNFSIFSQALVIIYLYGYSYPSEYEVASHCGLDLHFLDD